jgi:hypothetical protein
MIWFVAIKTFICFHIFFFNRIKVKRSRRDSWRRNAKLIKISNRRFRRNLFSFLIDRDRNDVYCATNCNFRLDLDRSDCIRASTKLCIVNTLIMILFQLCLTRQLIYIIYDIEFDEYNDLQFIKHFSLQLD